MQCVLIDSHVLVWLIYNSDKLSNTAKQQLQNANEVFVSQVSLIELTMKHGAGKLAYGPKDIIAGCKAANIQILPISTEHLQAYAGVALDHKDPFDRLLVAQCIHENMQLMTADTILLGLTYNTLKAD